MAIEILTVSPALVTPEEKQAIDELRAFRHVFRHGYQGQLDVEKLGLVDRRAPRALLAFRRTHERFLPVLDDLIQAVEVGDEPAPPSPA